MDTSTGLRNGLSRKGDEDEIKNENNKINGIDFIIMDKHFYNICRY